MKKVILAGFYLANLFFIISLWYSSSGSLLSVGRLFGLLAVFSVLTQVLLIGRVKWIEWVFGLDKLSRIHHYNGYLAIAFIVFHPVFIILSYSRSANISFVSQFVSFVFTSRDLLLAAFALVLFISIVFISISIVRRKLKYEYWYFTHLFMYLAIFFAFWHQLKFGGDFANKIFYYYWQGMYIFVFGNLIVFRFLHPLFNFFHFRFTVENVVRETFDTVSVYIAGKDIEKFKIIPGQFMIFRFLDKKLWWQAHPFSLSFLPQENHIRITVKNVGDFTSDLPKIKKGTPVIIDGPHGLFNVKKEKNKFLLIAGGVGITPLRSILEQLLREDKDAVLLYSSKSEKEIIFKQELDALKAKNGYKLFHILSQEEQFRGEKGHIDGEKIKRLVPDFKKREIYICGPVPMMEGLKSELESLGVSKSQIHMEKFSL